MKEKGGSNRPPPPTKRLVDYKVKLTRDNKGKDNGGRGEARWSGLLPGAAGERSPWHGEGRGLGHRTPFLRDPCEAEKKGGRTCTRFGCTNNETAGTSAEVKHQNPNKNAEEPWMVPARDHQLEAAAGAAAAAAGGEGTKLSAPGYRSPSSNASAWNAIASGQRADAGGRASAATSAALSKGPRSLVSEE